MSLDSTKPLTGEHPLASPARPQKKSGRRLKFSLRAMILAMTLFSVLLGGWTAYVRPFADQLDATRWVTRLGGKVQARPAEGSSWQRWLVTTMVDEDAFFETTSVDLTAIEIPNEAQPKFASLTHLQQVGLDGTGVDDRVISALGRARGLNELSLRYTGVTDVGLAILAKSPSLRTLRLTGNRVTDEGLALIASAPSLSELYLRWTDITPAGIEAFQKMRPNCVVHYHSSAGPNASAAPTADLSKSLYSGF